MIDDDSEQDEARVSRNLFDLFEQSTQAKARGSLETEAGVTANKKRKTTKRKRK